MISSPQHKLAKYLNDLLKPVFDHYSRYAITDSFEFAKIIQGTSANNSFMASFDVKSLFTNVPLQETVDICADALYRISKISLKKREFQETNGNCDKFGAI